MRFPVPSLSHLLAAAVAVYFGWAFYKLYLVAVPLVPPLLRADGSRKATLEPLWATSPTIDLALDLRLSTRARPATGGANWSTGEGEVPLLSLKGLRYGWDTLSLQVALEIAVLRGPWNGEPTGEDISAGAPVGMRVTCRDVPGGVGGLVAAAGPTTPPVVAWGALSWLAGSTTTRKEPSLCRKLALSLDASRGCRRRTRSGFKVSELATGRGGYNSGGVVGGSGSYLVAAIRGAAEALSAAAAAGAPNADSEAASSAVSAPVGKRMLLADFVATGAVLAPDAAAAVAIDCDGGGDIETLARARQGIAAVQLAEALLAGGLVYAHSSVSWASEAPYSGSLRAAAATTPLVLPLEYLPPREKRLLLADPWGNAAAAHAAAHAKHATLPSLIVARTLVSQRSASRKQSGGVGSSISSALVSAPCPLCAPGAPEHAAPQAGAPWPHWAGELSLRLVMDTAVFPRDELPPALAPLLARRESPSVGGRYAPTLAANPVRPVRERFLPLNASLARPLPLLVSLAPVSVGTWQLLSLLDASLDTQQKSMGASDRDTDEVVRMLSDTPLILLAATLAVSVVHLLFDVLALKSDVEFWASATSLRGISVRTLALGLGSQAIITAFLWIEGSSLLVLLPQAAWTSLQAWKFARAMGACLFLRGGSRDDFVSATTVALASDSRTSEYDATAVNFVGLLLAPLLIGFAVYTLTHHVFAGWADWALTTAVSAVYAFGFALMTPQIYINYRLKSVAHMPAGVLGYRFFNTIIDDLFAALVRMPLVARISVFRDDVVFVIYMVQRWYYPVDLSRPAEKYDADDSSTASSDTAVAALRKREASATASSKPATKDVNMHAFDDAKSAKSAGLRRLVDQRL